MREEEEGTAKRLPLKRNAHIVVSLKRPEEVETLRKLYGAGFFLVGIASSPSERAKYLIDERGFDEKQVKLLIETDAKEVDTWGQRTRDTFFLSDVFVTATEDKGQLRRFVDLVFGNPFETPTIVERSMYAAYSASFSSGDLARQVGAALVNASHDLLAVGWNDVPKFGGGLYSCGSTFRDMDLGFDSNDVEKGEMEALLSCGRKGISTQNASLFVTTFPCHNCTKHIIAAGVKEVFYIEPYAKSKAFTLHGDAISAVADGEKTIPFLPFVGIGPRRYLDLFSLTLGTGDPVERKANGKKFVWERGTAVPRLQMQPISYLDRETLAMSRLSELLALKTASE
jgi:deoxycytidylate deaminase